MTDPRPSPGTHGDFIYRAKRAIAPDFDDATEMVTALSCVVRYVDLDDKHHPDEPLRPHIGPLLLRIIRENRWQHFTSKLGDETRYERFEQFARTQPTKGLGVEPAALRDSVSDNPAALAALDEVLGINDDIDRSDEERELAALDNPAGAELLDELLATQKRYVVFPSEHAAVATTLWIAATHALPAFECAARLVITSPEKRCAKTRLLDIIAGTCHKPLATSDATVAAIFRSLGGDHPPTLLVDEADAMFGNKKVAEQNEDFRKLLNAGHQRGRPALRCVGPLQIPTEFSVFAMAALAGIGDMPDTITDRGVNITMRRRANTEKVSKFRSRRDGPILERLRDQLAIWAADRIEELSAAEPAMPVEDRAADTWEPLIAVADAAAGHWPDTARAACKALAAAADEADEDRSLPVKLLGDIRRVFTDKGVPFLPSAELVAQLRRIEDSPWDEFDMTARKLAYRLKDFGIKPGYNTAKTARGYRLDHLADVFARYIRPEPSKPSEPQVKHHFVPDGSESPDGSIYRNDSIYREETPGQIPFTDDWTGSDGSPTENGHGGPPKFCPGCGTFYANAGYHRGDCTASKQEGEA
jgi:Protein of unknown function (DUF3631)